MIRPAPGVIQPASRDRTSRAWLKEKLEDARWLIRALDQRQKTILKTAAEIVKKQEGFFRHGVTAMRPLTLREVAEQIEMHESTVSRVTSNKYMATPRGIYELKYFFTPAIAATGGGVLSAESVRHRIKALIDEEEPKKIKPIDLDDLSVEEIEEMIGNHKLEIKNLEILLKKKKDKLKLADQFFKKN